MVYLEWGPKQDYFVSAYQYYSYTRTVSYLYDLLKFIIDTPRRLRDDRCPRRSELQCKPPFDKHNREFAEGEFYLVEVHGNWKTEMDRLHLAVSVMLDERRCDRNYPDFASGGAAEIYAIEKIHEVLKLVREFKMNQQEFEYTFQLIWKDDDETTTI